MSSDTLSAADTVGQPGVLCQVAFGIKRTCDVVVCSAVCLIGFPLFALIAALVRLSSPGSIFFVQSRVGKNEKTFDVIKFRTMMGSPDSGAIAWTQAEESRITPIGRFLRDYGLDELPQVLNIIRGDMSVIGPRPPLPAQVMAYSAEQRKTFSMRPGVLSLAAIEGRRAIPMEQRIQLHVKYVEHWSLWLDLKILWRSLFVVLGRQNAAETAIVASKETAP